MTPCPFCGSLALDVCGLGEKRQVWFVACDECGATGPKGEVLTEVMEQWSKRAKVRKPASRRSCA